MVRPRQHGPLYDVFREVKRIFDPQNILNPGKVVADPATADPEPASRRGGAASPRRANRKTHELAAPHPSCRSSCSCSGTTTSMLDARARACNGCGECRTQSPEERMCPIFRFARAKRLRREPRRT